MTISLSISETDTRIPNTSLTKENKIDKFAEFWGLVTASIFLRTEVVRSIVFVVNSINSNRFLEFTEPNGKINCTIFLLYEIISLWEKHKEM